MKGCSRNLGKRRRVHEILRDGRLLLLLGLLLSYGVLGVW